MFEQTFKNIDDVLWKEKGCSTELDYTEQTSWILFLKYLDDLERANEVKEQLKGKTYQYILDKSHRWSCWAAPKPESGVKFKERIGPDLIEFVNTDLFPYLKGFRKRAEGPNTIEYKIGEIFSEIENKFRSGYALRDALDLVDELSFRSQRDKHELSHLYETKLQNMGNAGRNGGQYYTPRPLIRAMIEVVKPRIGERIYDGACGSAGFLCEAFEYLIRERDKLSTKDIDVLQTRTFVGKEDKPLGYVIGIMNMILHGIEAPSIIHTNTLTENINDIQNKDRYDVVLANPPFGGKERPEVQQNFPIKTGETAFLFLQHFIKSLRAGGRAAVVIKATFLSNSGRAAITLRKLLLESCDLHTVLVCPKGVFLGTGESTVVLFFEKGAPTRTVWFYQLTPGRSLGKTDPLNDQDLAEFVELQKSKSKSPISWSVDAGTVANNTYDLSPKNPNGSDIVRHSPQKILASVIELDRQQKPILERLGLQIGGRPSITRNQWKEKRVGDILQLEYGKPLPEADRKDEGKYPVYGANGEKDRSDKYYFDKPSIIVGRKGSAGELNLTERKFWPLDVTYFVTFDAKEYDLKFLFYLLRTLNLPSLAKGVKPGINRHEVYALRVRVPPLSEQQRFVSELDACAKEIQDLESLCQDKLSALAALNTSLLYNATTGKL